jgi:hypothetical protein
MGKMYASYSLSLVLCWSRGLKVFCLLVLMLFFFLAILEIKLQISTTWARFWVLFCFHLFLREGLMFLLSPGVIFSSWVAGTTGMCHPHPACCFWTGVWNSCLLGRRSNSSLFCSGYFWDMVLHFSSGQPEPTSFSEGSCHCWGDRHMLPFIEVRTFKLYCPYWPGTSVLLISTPQVARITGVSH